jgi:hypothetical protein
MSKHHTVLEDTVQADDHAQAMQLRGVADEVMSLNFGAFSIEELEHRLGILANLSEAESLLHSAICESFKCSNYVNK